MAASKVVLTVATTESKSVAKSAEGKDSNLEENSAGLKVNVRENRLAGNSDLYLAFRSADRTGKTKVVHSVYWLV